MQRIVTFQLAYQTCQLKVYNNKLTLLFNLTLFNSKERKHIKLNVKEDVAVVKIDAQNAKVNTLSREMFPEFISVMDEVAKNDKVKSVVIISGKTSGFIAGADINMIESCKTKEEIYQLSKSGQKIFDDMERSSKPIVSAIMGPCLG